MTHPHRHVSLSSNNSIVTIDLTSHPRSTPLGMLLAPSHSHNINNNSNNSNNHHSPTSSNVTLVAAWEHSHYQSHQNLGPIQRSGLVRLGDRLVRINGVDVTDWSFREVMDALKDLLLSNVANNNNARIAKNNKKRLKSLGFAPANTFEWSRGTSIPSSSAATILSEHGFPTSNQQCVVHSKRLYSFASFVGRWRVVDPNHHSTDAAAVSGSEHVEKEEEKERKGGEEGAEERDWNGHANSLLATASSVEEEHALVDEQQQQQQQQQQQNDLESAIPTLQEKEQLTPQISPSESKSTTPNPTTTTRETTPKPTTATTPPISNNTTNTTTKPLPEKPFIQYEIECHLLFRDPKSFSINNNTSTTNDSSSSQQHQQHQTSNTSLHHKWSIWKRYSEFSSLDTELRTTFGWQMDALHDGKGVVFPSSRGLESWWYGVRGSGGLLGSGAVVGSGSGGGGGYFSSLLGSGGGGSSSGFNGDHVGKKDNSLMNGADGSNTADAVGGNGSSSIFFGLFSSDNSESEPAATSSSNNNNHQTNAARNANDKPDNNIPSNSTTNNCPYPPSFMEKRQKELSSYWTSLMKIEDIFEFSDVTSHRFGKVMASFLGVDRILLSRQTSSSLSLGIHPNNQLHPQSASLSTRMNFPVIHENETFGYDAPVLHLSAVREMSGVIHHEDDVSILSDETGQARLLEASYTNGMNVIPPLHGNKVVDMVPHGYSNGVGGQGVVTSSAIAGGAVGSRGDVVVGITQSMERPYRSSSSSSSITSSSAVSQSGRRRMGPRRPQTGAKPAFQRQFFLP